MAEYKVGVRELKARLTFYIKQAQNGHTVIVTLRGRPIAQLTAIQEDAVVERAQRSGMEILPQE